MHNNHELQIAMRCVLDERHFWVEIPGKTSPVDICSTCSTSLASGQRRCGLWLPVRCELVLTVYCGRALRSARPRDLQTVPVVYTDVRRRYVIDVCVQLCVRACVCVAAGCIVAQRGTAVSGRSLSTSAAAVRQRRRQASRRLHGA